ncbi:conserved protein of unknown function [Pseudodesulfovibrio profundus]|uniref:ribonucleoside-diphosphate reductase n=1 Tax=Pseudodesulfovibrio profundus TaxID=57320 RepID=A0A2C8FCT6_9BACT|nr:TIGR03905 family TSCPD domain-containing protein [Pseudodesulfovibrio profundus]SOB60349.1 conserved protein of unknown function [Pseudodesulfovibrio profundus]
MDNLTELTPLAPMDGPIDVILDAGSTYKTENVCAKMIRFSVEEGKVSNLDFVGGCDGNLKAISRLLEGMEVGEVIAKLKGITCGKKDTSCTDQLCNALSEYAK